MLGILFSFLFRSVCALLPAFSPETASTETPSSLLGSALARAVLGIGKLQQLLTEFTPGAPLPHYHSLVIQALRNFIAIKILNCHGQSELGNTQNPLNSCSFHYHISVFLKVIFQSVLGGLHHSEAASVAWVEVRSFCPLRCFLL